jgi:hypothetical protein
MDGIFKMISKGLKKGYSREGEGLESEMTDAESKL